jgi:hypothetical protein
MAIHVLNITHDELFTKYDRLYRFIPIERLLQIIETKRMAFINPEYWEDPFEKMYINGQYQINGKLVEWPLRNKVYCMCFTRTASSEAFWKGYTPLNDGVRLKLKTKEFAYYLEGIHDVDVYVGKVDYKLTDEILKFKKNFDYLKNELLGKNHSKNIELLLYKRKSFSYEDEIRFIVVPRKTVTDSKLFQLDIEPQKYFAEFLLHPKLGLHHGSILKKYLKQTAGINTSHSRLYNERKVKINLSK